MKNHIKVQGREMTDSEELYSFNLFNGVGV